VSEEDEAEKEVVVEEEESKPESSPEVDESNDAEPVEVSGEEKAEKEVVVEEDESKPESSSEADKSKDSQPEGEQEGVNEEGEKVEVTVVDSKETEDPIPPEHSIVESVENTEEVEEQSPKSTDAGADASKETEEKVESVEDEENVSKELEYMVKEYGALSSENSQLRERIAQIESEKNESIEKHVEDRAKLVRLANTALLSLKEEKFSKDISKEAVQELEKSVSDLQNKISEKDTHVTHMKDELQKYKKGEIQKLKDLAETAEAIS